jgi:membrane-associated phospholipid phosphatase
MAHPASARVRPAEVAAVLAGAPLLVVSWVIVAAGGHVPALERRTFEAINRLPDALWPIVWAPMQLGSLAGALVVVAVIQVVGRNVHLTLAALTASLVAWWSAKGVKAFVSRARPGALLTDVRLHEHASGLGYVSGHSAVAFALAAVVAPSVPSRWRFAVFGLATLVAFARVYAGAHLPLDAIGGAGLGVLVGTLTRWAFGLGGEGLPRRDGLR